MGLIKNPVVDETDPCEPSTPYQKSKYKSEQVIREYWIEHGFPSIILRPCMIYGTGGAGEFLKFCRLIKRGLFPKIGRGKNLTPIVHVKDVVQAALLSLDKGKPGEIYLITSKESYELATIRALIAKYLGVKKPYFYVPTSLALPGAYCLETLAMLLNFTPVVTSKNIRSTVTDRVFSIKKAEQHLGYKPVVDLSNGIKETVAYYVDSGLL
jgi:nucleoside-diphosphate-sugar epimerase